MKKAISMLAAGLILAVAAPASFAGGAGESEDSNVIGISKIVSHPALDGVEQGIQDELADLGYDFEYDLQNANGDVTAANQIATKFRDDRVRVAIGIATPTSQALVNSITEFPVIYSAVTDPVEAGLVEDYESGGPNITGVSDMTPVQEQIELLAEFMDVQSLGHVYATGESNAVRLAELAKETADDMGIEFIEATVTNSSEVRTATQSIVDQVDAIYISTDNTVVSALSAVTDVATEAGVPVITADPSSAEDYDVLAALGFDYYQMGRVTGRLVADIIEGEDPSEIGTVYMTDPEDQELLINLDVAEQLGISIPDSAIEMANSIVEDGELRTQ